MEQTKTGTYFKYAIGKIILVLMGIFIALQINNWNQERKENKHGSFIFQNYKTILILISLLLISK
jgi:hypothetical protein